MSDDRVTVNIYNADDGGEEEAEVTRLKPTFARLLLELKRISEIEGEAERREAHISNTKEFHRAAFLTHPEATEEDFERLWPRMFDDLLCEHASIVYMQTMGALGRDFKEGKSPADYLPDKKSEKGGDA